MSRRISVKNRDTQLSPSYVGLRAAVSFSRGFMNISGKEIGAVTENHIESGVGTDLR